MNETPNGDDEVDDTSVLRPYEPTPMPDLPPVEASRVVPVPRDVEPAAPDPVADEAVGEEPVVEEPVVEERTAEEPVGEAAPAGVPDIEHHAVRPEPEADDTDGDTITLPRMPFLVGLGLLLAAVVALPVLWRSDDAADTVEPPASSTPADIVATDPVTTDASPAVATTDPDGALDAAMETAEAEIAGLRAEVEHLESRPAPALPGTRLRRIIVGADARYLSAQADSITVIGSFGGLSVIDPSTNSVTANAVVTNAANRVMRTSSSVWITDQADDVIIRVDPATNAATAVFPFLGPDGIVKDGDTIVVASSTGGFVARLDPTSGAVIQQVDVGGSPTAVFSHADHGLWAAVADTGEIVQIDPASFEIVQRVIVGAGTVGITADATSLWVANHDERTIARIDPATSEVLLTVVVGDGPTDLVVVDNSVWVTLTEEGSVVQVDVVSGEILTRTPLGGASAGGGPTGIVVGDESLWVAVRGERSVVRITL